MNWWEEMLLNRDERPKDDRGWTRDFDGRKLVTPETLEAKMTDGLAGEIEAPPFVDGELKDRDNLADLKTTRRVRAEKFVDLIKSGASPQEAASKVHSSKAVMEKDPDVKALVTSLIAQYEIPKETRTRAAKAKLNQIMLTGESDKIQMEAAKAVINEETGGTPLVNFNFTGETQKVFDSLDIPVEIVGEE